MTNRQILLSKTETLSDTEISEVLNYINSIESLRDASSLANAATDPTADYTDDEVVRLLSEAVENRRARVVAEWDKIRRRADYRAASYAAGRK